MGIGGDVRRTLHDIDAQIEQARGQLIEADLEAGLQDIRDLSKNLGNVDLEHGAITELASWRRIVRSKSQLTDEQVSVEFRKHIARSLDLLKSLQESIAPLVQPITDESRELRKSTPSSTRPPAQPPITLRCADVFKEYRHGFRLAGVSFEISTGEVLGVVGANGSGKTTLLRIVAGDLALDGGEIALGDAVPGTRSYLARVAYVPQRPPAWSGTVRVHLQWHAALAGVRDLNANTDAVDDAMAWLQLATNADKRFSELSEGQRMRVAIAAAILTRPQMLVLDEPLAPLDPMSQLTLLGWIRRYTREWRGLITVLSSQHIPEIEMVTDRVLCFQYGHLVPSPSDRPRCFEVMPRNDTTGFDTLKTILTSIQRDGIVSQFVPCERYAMIVIAPGQLEIEMLASHLSSARPLMIRDISASARRTLLLERHP